MNDLPARSFRLQPLTRHVSLNSIWLLLARLFAQAALFLSTALIARALGVASFGQYAFVAALIFLGNVATTFGTDTLLIREVARDRRAGASLTGAALWLQLALSAMWLLAVVLAAPLLIEQPTDVQTAVVVYSLSLFPLAFFTVFSAVLRAHERMDLVLLLNGGVAVLQLGGTGWVLAQSRALLPLVVMLNAVHLFAAILAGVVCRRHLRAFSLHWKMAWRQLAQIARLAWPFALLGVLAVLYQRLGTLMVSALGTEAETGWYAAASRVIEPVKLLHFAVLGALLPALAHLSASLADPAQAPGVVRVFQRSLWFLLAVSAAAALAIIVLAQPLVTLLFGASYIPSVPLVQILAVSLIPYTISAAWSVRRVVQGHERRVTSALAITLVAAALLNRWLIPTQGATGAALAAVAGECLFAVILLRTRRNEARITPNC
jgi:O-antigen/teichoic acid export membrane protein